MKKRRDIKEIDYLLPKIKDFVQRILGDQLRDVILYGSFAKHRATLDSDIDIAVILKDGGDTGQASILLNEFFSDLGLESNELISCLLLRFPEIENSPWPLYRSLLEEGIRL